MKKLARAAVIVAIASGSFGYACPSNAPDILAAYSFAPLVPPSNMVTVGTVLAVEGEVVAGHMGERLKVSCGPRASLGQDFIPSSSATVGQTYRDKTVGSWKIEAEMLDRISGRFDTSKINSIDVTVTNARILSLSDADVLENLRNRSDECRLAIRTRLQQGYTLTMVNAALVADLQYRVDWKETKSIDKKARLVEMQKLAASLGGGQTRIGLSQMESRGLALGIRTDAFLLALSVPEMDERSEKVAELASKEKRVGMHPITAEAEEPDAPYVLPKGNNYAAPEFVFE